MAGAHTLRMTATLATVTVLTTGTLGGIAFFYATWVRARPARPVEPLEPTEVALGFAPASIAADPDGRSILMTDPDGGALVRWDVERRRKVQRLALDGARALFVRGDRAFVALVPSAVVEVDLGSFALVKKHALPSGVTIPPFVSHLAGSDRRGEPVFASCLQGEQAVVVALNESGSRVVTSGSIEVHPSGRVAVVRRLRPLPPLLRELTPTGDLGREVGPLEGGRVGAVPDVRGEGWLAIDGVWDLTLTKRVARMAGQHAAFHPTQRLLYAFGASTVKVFDTETERAVFSATVRAPPTGQASSSDQAVVVATTTGTVLAYTEVGRFMTIAIPRETLAPAEATTAWLPSWVPAAPSVLFAVRLSDPKTRATFRAVTLPPGCRLDATRGELVWTNPRPGVHELSLEVVPAAGAPIPVKGSIAVGLEAIPPPAARTAPLPPLARPAPPDAPR